MALATSLPRESLARCSRIQASRSATSGALSSWRTALRLSALCPLIVRSMSNRASIRRTASNARARSRRLFALSLATRVLRHIGHDEERAAGMAPHALRRPARRAAGLIELAVAAIGVGLEDSGVGSEVRLGMLASPFARVIEHSGGGAGPKGLSSRT